MQMMHLSIVILNLTLDSLVTFYLVKTFSRLNQYRRNMQSESWSGFPMDKSSLLMPKRRIKGRVH